MAATTTPCARAHVANFPRKYKHYSSSSNSFSCLLRLLLLSAVCVRTMHVPECLTNRSHSKLLVTTKMHADSTPVGSFSDINPSILNNCYPSVYSVYMLNHLKRSVMLCTSFSKSRPSTALIICILLMAGDVQPNPGPIKYPCSSCGKAVANNHNALNCDTCHLWTHIKCGGES